MKSQVVLNYKGFDFFIKNIKRPIFQQVIGGKDCETSTTKIILILKLNQLLKTNKLCFTNWKTNKQMMLNFVLTSDRSWRAKYIQKPFSKYLKDRICQINI